MIDILIAFEMSVFIVLVVSILLSIIFDYQELPASIVCWECWYSTTLMCRNLNGINRHEAPATNTIQHIAPRINHPLIIFTFIAITSLEICPYRVSPCSLWLQAHRNHPSNPRIQESKSTVISTESNKSKPPRSMFTSLIWSSDRSRWVCVVRLMCVLYG